MHHSSFCNMKIFVGQISNILQPDRQIQTHAINSFCRQTSLTYSNWCQLQWQHPYMTYSLVRWTPPLNPLSKCPLPRPPAKICALTTNSAAPAQYKIDNLASYVDFKLILAGDNYLEGNWGGWKKGQTWRVSRDEVVYQLLGGEYQGVKWCTKLGGYLCC